MSVNPLPHRPLKLAHRGLRSATAPENSLAALAAAQAAGWDGSEFDIHISAEGTPFVFHDDDLQRMCAQPAAIYDTPAAQLAQLPLLDTAETIPRYDTVLARFARTQVLYSEIKIPDAHWHNPSWIAYQVQQVLAVFAPYAAHYQGWLASFHPIAVQHLIAHYPDHALAICDTQAEFDHHYTQWGPRIPYALSHRNAIDPGDVPLSRILYWDIDPSQPLPDAALAYLWDA